MTDLPFDFADLPGEMRITVYDQLSYPGVDQPRYRDSEFLGTTIEEWASRYNQRSVLAQDFFRIHADHSGSQVVPRRGFYTNQIIKLGRDFGYEFDHRIHARWFTPVMWEAECMAVSTVLDDEYFMGGCNGYLRWNRIPRTFDTAPQSVCLTVRLFMDEKLMEAEWVDLDDETSDLSDEIVDSHCEMILEVGMQLSMTGMTMRDWREPQIGQGGDGFPQLDIAVQAFTKKVPEGLDASNDGASLYDRETLMAWAEQYPEGTRYWPLPAKTVSRMIQDLGEYVDEGNGRFQFALNDTVITERDELERPIFEVPKGEYIYKYECTYFLR